MAAHLVTGSKHADHSTPLPNKNLLGIIIIVIFSYLNHSIVSSLALMVS